MPADRRSIRGRRSCACAESGQLLHHPEGHDRTGPFLHQGVVEAFLAASRDGRFDDLLILLDPHVVLRSDAAAVRMGGTGEEHGSSAVAGFFSGRAQAAMPAFVDGAPGAVVVIGGRTRIVISFVVTDRIIGIEVVADPDQIAAIDLVVD